MKRRHFARDDQYARLAMLYLRNRPFTGGRGPAARLGTALLALALLAAVMASAASSGCAARPLAFARPELQLPGGGRVLFPGHLLVALYGHPPALPRWVRWVSRACRQASPGPGTRPRRTGL